MVVSILSLLLLWMEYPNNTTNSLNYMFFESYHRPCIICELFTTDNNNSTNIQKELSFPCSGGMRGHFDIDLDFEKLVYVRTTLVSDEDRFLQTPFYIVPVFFNTISGFTCCRLTDSSWCVVTVSWPTRRQSWVDSTNSTNEHLRPWHRLHV